MSKAEDQLESIWTTARQAAEEGRCTVDPEIPRSEFGYGMGVTVLAMLSPDAKEAIVRLQKSLEPYDPEQYWYPLDSLHVTLHGVAWRERGDLPSEMDFIRITNTLRPTFVGAGYPELTINGPMIFPGTERQVGTVSVQAIPNPDLLLLRDRVRQCVMDAGYPDRRNYAFGRGDYLTCTLARFRKQPSRNLIERISALRDREVAKFYVTETALVTNSYFCDPKRTTVRERFAIV